MSKKPHKRQTMSKKPHKRQTISKKDVRNQENYEEGPHTRLTIEVDGTPLFDQHVTESQEKRVWNLIARIGRLPRCEFNGEYGG